MEWNFRNIYMLCTSNFSAIKPECPFRAICGVRNERCAECSRREQWREQSKRDETVSRESLPMKPERGSPPLTKLSNVPKASESQNGK